MTLAETDAEADMDVAEAYAAEPEATEAEAYAAESEATEAETVAEATAEAMRVSLRILPKLVQGVIYSLEQSSTSSTSSKDHCWFVLPS